jgi:uncharacterized protein YkwD
MTAAAASLALLAALGVAPAPPPKLTPLKAATLDRVRQALPQRTVPALSEPLAQAARALARAAAAGEPRPLSSSALRAALDEAGVVDPAPAAVVLSSRAASLPEAMAAAARFRGATHLGIGVVVRDDLAWAVLLASERRAEIDPFPRRLVPGSRARLGGRLLHLDGPRVWVSTPSGAAFEVPVESDGRRFSASILFSEPGAWRVEVGGVGARGPSVAALLEVACTADGSLPHSDGTPGPSDPGDGEARIRAEANALRARQGLPPLRSASALDEQARRHSEAMLAAATVAHRLEGGGDLSARLAAAGIPFRSGRENVARGDGALDAHRAMVGSPAHLANLLAPEVQLMGMGIARGVLPGGQPVVYLTEILVEPRDPLPVGDPPTGAR